MKRILLLTNACVDDNDEAALNLATALERISPANVKLERADLLRTHGPVSREIGEGALPGGRRMAEARDALRDLLQEQQPDVVLITSPAYGILINAIYQGGRARDFCLIGLAMELAGPSWAGVPADFFAVADRTIEQELMASGIARERVKVFGYPLSAASPARHEKLGPPGPGPDGPLRILFLANGAGKKAPKLLGRILAEPDWKITVCCQGHPELADKFRRVAQAEPDRLEFVDDSPDLPALLSRHDVVITRASTPIVREAVAAHCPVIVPKRGTRREAANLALLQRAHAGAGAEKPSEVIAWLLRACNDDGRLLALWRKNTEPLCHPDATMDLARFVLQQAAHDAAPVARIHALPPPASVEEPAIGETSGKADSPHRYPSAKRLLLCDLHSHTTWSDGKLTVRELVDFYGQRGFDCLCITDHLCDPMRLLGKLVNLTGLVIPPGELEKYFEAIEREKKRAWAKYDLLLMTGLEFNKDGYTARTSAHLLGIDLKAPLNPSLGIEELIGEIHAQGALAVASHPHETRSRWGKDTLYFWENVDRFAPLLDAWEVANRDDIFNPIGLKKLPFIANSDFHKPKHIHSWKTLLYCEKQAEAIKHCIRVNRDVSLTLYRDHRFGWEEPALEAPRREEAGAEDSEQRVRAMR